MGPLDYDHNKPLGTLWKGDFEIKGPQFIKRVKAIPILLICQSKHLHSSTVVVVKTATYMRQVILQINFTQKKFIQLSQKWIVHKTF